MRPGYGDKPDGYYANVSPLVVELLAPPPGARILDVGCADGALGRFVKSEDPEAFVAGVEAHGPAAARARAALDEVWAADFEAWEPPPHYAGYFDCIVFGDVLEHLIDPQGALRKAVRLLRSDGSIVASIPNVRWLPIIRDLLLRGQWTYRSEGVLDQTHLRFFTRSSMLALFERCGLEIEVCLPGISAQWGAVGALLRLLARRSITCEELCAIQYVVKARVSPTSDPDAGE